MQSIPELDRKGLRDFGFVTGGILAVLFGILFPWVLSHPYPYWPWVLAIVLAIWGLAAPHTLRPVYRVWMRFGLVLNRVTTPIIMGVVFFLVIAPVSLGMRLFGRDPMARNFDDGVKSYRIASTKAPKEHMEKPF